MSDVELLEMNDPADNFFIEVGCILVEDNVSPVNAPTLPHDGKAPTDTQREAKLATAVEGGNRDKCINSMPSQGLHVTLPNADCSMPANDRDEVSPEPMDSSATKDKCWADLTPIMSEDKDEGIGLDNPWLIHPHRKCG